MVVLAKSAAGVPKLLRVDTDDGEVGQNQAVQVVICLNYVWDAGNTKWIRMTQP